MTEHMNLLEFRKALTSAGMDSSIWTWEEILNVMICGFEYQIGIAQRNNDEKAAQEITNRAQFLYDILKSRGYYGGNQNV